VGGRIYTAVNGAKMEGNPSEMARAPAGQVFASRALAAAPREPGSGEKVDLGVPGEPGRGGGFAREGPGSQAGAGHQTTPGCMRGCLARLVRVTKQTPTCWLLLSPSSLRDVLQRLCTLH
jgi:hypothetical protein